MTYCWTFLREKWVFLRKMLPFFILKSWPKVFIQKIKGLQTILMKNNMVQFFGKSMGISVFPLLQLVEWFVFYIPWQGLLFDQSYKRVSYFCWIVLVQVTHTRLFFTHEINALVFILLSLLFSCHDWVVDFHIVIFHL